MSTLSVAKNRLGQLGSPDMELAEAFRPAGGLLYGHVKRVLDVGIAAALVVLLSPVMLLAAILIKLTSRGPVIFKQVRAGIHEAPFVMYKFRTMRQGAEEDRAYLEHLNEKDGPIFKMRGDPRLTRVGRFLRRSSIDELPQLFNVLSGEMSLVGPRPLWYPEAKQAKGAACHRMRVKPGMTCLWQISGRSELSYDEWVLLDLYYIRHRSTVLDLLIILQTMPAVLSARGAY